MKFARDLRPARRATCIWAACAPRCIPYLFAKKHGGIEETITVRRLAYGVGVEKVFPLHSPSIEKIETVRTGFVRRAKLYYLRDRVGKAAKVKEKL